MRIFYVQAEDGIRDIGVTGVQTCALPILPSVLNAVVAGCMVLLVAGAGWLTLAAPVRPRFAQLAFLLVAGFLLLNKGGREGRALGRGEDLRGRRHSKNKKIIV